MTLSTIIELPKDLPRVLVITSNLGTLAELRMRNPLRALHRMHMIAGFEVVDSDLHPLRSDENRYHVIIIQRAVPEYIYESLNTRGIPYALDIDDNMLATPAYQKDVVYNAIHKGLLGCQVLITPTTRLVHLLERYSGYSLSEKSRLVPNALPYPRSFHRKPAQPEQLLWIQSDISALSSSIDDIVRAIDDFSLKYDLPVILIGRNVLDRRTLSNQVEMGEIDLTALLQYLSYAPPSIGLAPLETQADEETMDFIAGKSDMKMLLFTGYGHPGIYSRSPPYEDSPLINTSMLTLNTYSAWLDALEYQYHCGWKDVSSDALHIRRDRNTEGTACKDLLPALQSCRISCPMRGKDIYDMIRKTRMKYLPLIMGYNLLIRLGFQKNDIMRMYNQVKQRREKSRDNEFEQGNY